MGASLDEYVDALVGWCRKEASILENKQARYPAVIALADKARDKLRVPWHKLDVLTKYQTTLDNQLYKAIKALKDAQEWRMQSINAIELIEKDAPPDPA